MKNKLALLMALGLALPVMALAQDSDERPARDEDRRPRFERNDGERSEGRERSGRPARRNRDDRETPDRPREREVRARQEGFRREGLNHGAGMRREQGPRPVRPPLLVILDVNRDGVIDAVEIEQAPKSLRKLDRNGDGELTRRELALAFRYGGHPGRGGGEHFRPQHGPGRGEDRPDRGPRAERRSDDERPRRDADRSERFQGDHGDRDRRDREDAPRPPRRSLPQEDRE